MRAVAALIALHASGCDVVYGLSGRMVDAAVDAADADPCPNDRDCDLVQDPVDNCPDRSNSDQDDVDDDDIGDLCDPCSETPSTTVDDDSDSRPDASDNCPGLTNFGQMDADGDGVGDACDAQPGVADSLGCYFGFHDAAASNRLWPAVDPWRVESSRLTHYPPMMMPFTIAARPSGLLASHDSFDLTTTMVFTAPFMASFKTGIEVGPLASAEPGVRCLVEGTFQASQALVIRSPSDAVLAMSALPALFSGGFQVLSLRYLRQGTSTVVTCTVTDGVGSPVPITATTDLPGELEPRLVAVNTQPAFSSLAIYRLGP